MAPPISKKWHELTDEFHRKFIWYLDIGMGKDNRSQGIEEIANFLGISFDVVAHWKYRIKPTYWKLVLFYLETKYGFYPSSVWKKD